MIYLYGYLGIGVAVLAVLSGASHWASKTEPQSLHHSLNLVFPDRSPFFWRVLDAIIVPVMVAIFAIAMWPIVVYMRIQASLNKNKNSGAEFSKAREFAVERQHLQQRLTVQEIERLEMVTDPLNAVPELPFGHLNTAWQEFLGKHGADGELWSFVARWPTAGGGGQLRSGYVVVNNGAPGAHFLTVAKDISGEAGVAT